MLGHNVGLKNKQFLGHLQVILTFDLPNSLPPSEHCKIHFFFPKEFIEHVTPTFESSG